MKFNIAMNTINKDKLLKKIEDFCILSNNGECIYLFMNKETLNALMREEINICQSNEKLLKAMLPENMYFLLSNSTQSLVYYYGCKVFYDSEKKFGEVEIR